MANENVRALYEFMFQKIMLGVPSGFTTYNPTDTELSALWATIYNADFTGKMALVPDATVDNFAMFDEAGQVIDSLKNANSFAPLAHNHDGLYVQLGDAMLLVAGAVEGNFAMFDAAGQVEDSLKNASSFAALAHNHDTRYLRWDLGNIYDSDLYVFTWSVDDGVPFVIDNTSGDPLPVVTHLNADKLDGYDASAFALVNHRHSGYYPRMASGASETIVADWTFDRVGTGVAPFVIAADNNGVVQYLNAQMLNSKVDTDFALAGHTHGDIYYTEDEIDAMVALLLAKPTEGAADGSVLVYDGIGATQTSVDLSTLATVTQIGLKYDEIAGVNGNLVAFATSGTTLADSGYAPAAFAAASHNHDDRYYTETEMGNGTLDLSFDTLTLANAVPLIFAAGAMQTGDTGAGTLTNAPTAGNPTGFIKMQCNGVDYGVPAWILP